MRFRRRVVFPEPRKPVTMVTGMGGMMVKEKERCLYFRTVYRVWIAVLR